MKTLLGKFKWDPRHDSPIFHPNSGESFIADLTEKPDIIFKRELEATFRENVLVSFRESPLADASNMFKIALVHVVSEGEEVSDFKRKKHLERAILTQNTLNFLSKNKYVFKVDPYFRSYPAKAFQLAYYHFKWRDLREELPGYTHYHCVGGTSINCGLAGLGADIGWTYNPTTCDFKTTVHEILHNLFLHHAGTPQKEYGEYDVIMGSGGLRESLNAPHFYKLGVMAADNIVEIENSESKRVWLVQAGTFDMAVPMNADLIAIARTPRGENKRIAVSVHKGKVDIHVPGTAGSQIFQQTTLLKTLSLSDTFTIDNVKIKVIDRDEMLNAYLVDISNNTTENAPDILTPIFPEPDQAYGFMNISGIWRHPEWSGQGFQIRYLKGNDQVFVAWLTWDLYNNAVWFYATLDIIGTMAKGALYSGRSPEAVGWASLYFTDQNHGVFRAGTSERLWAQPLERLSATVPRHPLAGYWGLGNQEGLSLEMTKDGRLIGYWLTYKNVGTPVLPREALHWRFIQQFREEDRIDQEDSRIDGKIYIYDVFNGMLGVKAETSIKKVSELSIDNDNISFNLDGVERQLAMQRFT